jgi:hypothetical protein
MHFYIFRTVQIDLELHIKKYPMFGGVLLSNNANCEYKLQLDSFVLLNIAVQ